MDQFIHRLKNAAKKAEPITPKLNVIFSIPMIPLWLAILLMFGYPYLVINVLGRKDFFDLHLKFIWCLIYLLIFLSGFLMIVRNEGPGAHYARIEKGKKNLIYGAFFAIIGIIGFITMVIDL
jgi:hypothetical protein